MANLPAPPPGSDLLPKRANKQGNKAKAFEEVVQEGMFFAMLNRDVRMIIYDFLYRWLPPLPYKMRWRKEDDCRGMVLACKQANEELCEAAARHLKLFADKFAIDFEKQNGHPIKLHSSIPLHQGWQALRTVTLSLDINFFANLFLESGRLPADLSAPDWKASQWRLLLQRPFDKVTLLITDAGVQDRYSSENKDQLEKYQLIVELLREKIDEMGDHIGSDWHSFQTALDFEVICEEYDPPACYFNKYGEYDDTPRREYYQSAELFRFARVQYERLNTKGGREEVERRYDPVFDKGLSRRRIQTKHICFAWDFHPSTNPGPQKLTGQKFTYTAEHAEKLRKTDQLRKLKYENQWPHKYEVMSKDGLVGEMGIRHPKRWTLASEEYTEYSGLGLLTEKEDVESKGIGMKVIKVRKPRGKETKTEG